MAHDPTDPFDQNAYARDLAPNEKEFNAAVEGASDARVLELAEQLIADGNVPPAPGSLEVRARLAAQEQLAREGVFEDIRQRLASDPEWQERLDPTLLARQSIIAMARRHRVFVDDVTPLPEGSGALAAVTAYACARSAVWLVRFHLATRDTDRAAVIVRLDVVPFEPEDAAVTHTLLAALPVPALIRRAIEALERDARFVAAFEVLGPRSGRGLPSPEERQRLRDAARRAGALRPQRGRKATPIEFYEMLAIDLVEIARQPRAGGVTAELARRRGTPNHPVPLDTVKSWIRKARKPEIGALAPRGWELGPRFNQQDEEDV